MHIPDGLLAPEVWLPLAGVAAAGCALAARRTASTLDDRRVPLMGVLGAFVFAAQMVNFPVGPGTSGHLAGGVLLAALLGPAAAALVMACVLVLQCLLFADGGLTALGANVVNLALLAVYGGHLLRRVLLRVLPESAATFLAAWASVVTAAAAVALEAAASGHRLEAWLPLMVGVHAVVGLGEGAITVAALRAVRVARPDLAGRPA
ncbi:MAG: energy-coupling factor ABC transporter permease [Planctomycetes bacterium]|nr:energy-coupling factor ABC transporter permease [Planctomycetota bacterium]